MIMIINVIENQRTNANVNNFTFLCDHDLLSW